eukprot:365555-Chlamydomonas_euryale.AAC.8
MRAVAAAAPAAASSVPEPHVSAHACAPLVCSLRRRRPRRLRIRRSARRRLAWRWRRHCPPRRRDGQRGWWDLAPLPPPPPPPSPLSRPRRRACRRRPQSCWVAARAPAAVAHSAWRPWWRDRSRTGRLGCCCCCCHPSPRRTSRTAYAAPVPARRHPAASRVHDKRAQRVHAKGGRRVRARREAHGRVRARADLCVLAAAHACARCCASSRAPSVSHLTSGGLSNARPMRRLAHLFAFLHRLAHAVLKLSSFNFLICGTLRPGLRWTPLRWLVRDRRRLHWHT